MQRRNREPRQQPANVHKLLTAEEFERLPDDGNLYELVRGRLVVMSRPDLRHGQLVMRIGQRMANHVEANGLGTVIAGDPGCILERGPDTVRGPDVAFVSIGRHGPGPMPESYLVGSPDMAVEVVSKSDRRPAVHERALAYLSAGARRVWIVDPRARTLRVYRPDAPTRTLAGGDVLDGEDVLPGFRLPIDELFC